MRWWTLGAGMWLAGAVVATSAHAGTTCGQAQREVARAQQTLAQATRGYDAAASSLHACMKRRAGRCAAEKKALDAAAHRRAEAREALHFAQEQARLACE